MQGVNECTGKVLDDNNIKDEVREFMSFVLSEEWIKLVEYGT